MSPPSDLSATALAQVFAQALDRDDFESAALLIAEDCVYHARDGQIIGPAAICSSYQEASLWAKSVLDSVEYESVVLPACGVEVAIQFVDHIKCKGRQHTYTCQQWLRVSPLGTIDAIRHQELPGQREELVSFLQSVGIHRP